MMRITLAAAALVAASSVSPACAASGEASPADSASLTELMSIHTQAVNHELGRGAPLDLERAASFYRQAARLGYADSQNDLAKLYEDGRGVLRDPIEAYFWYTLAAANGNPQAIASRDDLLARMNEAERTEARRRVLEPGDRLP